MRIYKGRFKDAFQGSPEDYIFIRMVDSLADDPEMELHESCACGKLIRYLFIVAHVETGHEVILGSKCINNYKELGMFKMVANEEVKKHLKAKREKIRTEQVKKGLDECRNYYRVLREMYPYVAKYPDFYNGPQYKHLKRHSAILVRFENYKEKIKPWIS